jgi:hypothetical protein
MPAPAIAPMPIPPSKVPMSMRPVYARLRLACYTSVRVENIGDSELATWRVDVLLDWVTPIPSEALAEARRGLGPAGAQGPDIEGSGRPVVSLYANALDRKTGEQALERELEVLLTRLQRWAPTVARRTAVTYAHPAFPPTTGARFDS